ncbi:MAG: aldose 1-epimerase family protein [Pirellula sp.]|nr:aldose 1-epimerase family protein [Pirellula sp.]
MLHWQLISPTRSDESNLRNSSDPISQEIQLPDGTVRFDWSSWNSGKSLGMQCLTIDTPAMRTVVLPMRGMGIWKSWVQGIEFGWQSPVAGPVHPALVPVADPSGIGWLEGFDELLVRCGDLLARTPDSHAVPRRFFNDRNP